MFNKVMGSILNSIKGQSKDTMIVSENSSNQLLKSEIEFLLTLIKTSNFKGEQLETVFNTAVKLQNQYLSQTQSKV